MSKFKFKQKTALSSILLLTTIAACDNTEYFDKELYEKMIYIVSGTNNVDVEEFSFDPEGSVRNISFSSSGTKEIEKDVVIEIEPDNVLLPIFNKVTFDQDTKKYAKVLNPNLYDLGSSKIVLKNGETQALLPVTISAENLEKLSPDSIYFVPITIKSVSNYTVNEKKKNVLFRIQTSNKYAQTKKKTYYSLKGYKTDTLGTTYTNSLITSASKVMVPLSKNEIRILIGNTNIGTTPTLEDIRKNSLILKVNDDKTVDIRTYKSTENDIIVEQLKKPLDNPDFPYGNIYDSTKEKERFMLYYRYKTFDTAKKTWSRWFYMKEDLRRLEGI